VNSPLWHLRVDRHWPEGKLGEAWVGLCFDYWSGIFFDTEAEARDWMTNVWLGGTPDRLTGGDTKTITITSTSDGREVHRCIYTS